jgi:hypothetical protein
LVNCSVCGGMTYEAGTQTPSRLKDPIITECSRICLGLSTLLKGGDNSNMHIFNQ